MTARLMAAGVAVTIVGGLGSAGALVWDVQELVNPGHAVSCAQLVQRFEQDPRICGGGSSFVVKGLQACETGWLPTADPTQVQVRPGKTGNGNCIEGVAAAAMARQGLTPNAKRLGG